MCTTSVCIVLENFYPLSSAQVNWVLGIPASKKVVLSAENAENHSVWSYLRETYCKRVDSGVAGRKRTEGIPRSTIMRLVEDETDDELNFKRGFLMIILCDLLCPTTCHRLSIALFPAIWVAMNAVGYDWCTFVVDQLVLAIARFARRFYRHGYALGCGSCMFFLASEFLTWFIVSYTIGFTSYLTGSLVKTFFFSNCVLG